MKRTKGLNPLKKPVKKLKVVSDSKTNFFDVGRLLAEKLAAGQEITIQGRKFKI